MVALRATAHPDLWWSWVAHSPDLAKRTCPQIDIRLFFFLEIQPLNCMFTGEEFECRTYRSKKSKLQQVRTTSS